MAGTAPRLGAIHLYPVKSARGLGPGEAVVEPWGLAGDRRWMLTTPQGRCLTQREQPRLALVEVLPEPDGALLLRAPGMPPLRTPRPAGDAIDTVLIWSDEVPAVPADEAAHAWFSRYLGNEARLVHLDDPGAGRPMADGYAPRGATVSFADAFPLLLTTTASLAALDALVARDARARDTRPPGPLPMNRFRPNVVIEGTEPWAEDHWRRVRIGEVAFRVAKPCGRCVVTTTDQETAERGREPLRALGRHRRFGKNLVFGQNLVPECTGVLRLGDAFSVLG